MSETVFNPDNLREDIDIEAKLAGGREGRGALPQSLFETYSAFANTGGGLILLGLRERDDRNFEIVGIEHPDKIIEDLWNQLNNPNKVSCNLLDKKSVRKHPTDNGRWIVEIEVPRATRREYPVFIKGNPLEGTFKMLLRDGHGLAATYRLSGVNTIDLAQNGNQGSRSARKDGSSAHMDPSSAHIDPSSTHIDDAQLLQIAGKIRGKSRIKPACVRGISNQGH